MIDFEATNLKELCEELSSTGTHLRQSLKRLEKMYISTKETLSRKEFTHLRYYYENDALDKLIKSTTNLTRNIDSLLSEPTINDYSLKKINDLTTKNYIDKIVSFKEDWLNTFNNNNYEKFYKEARDINDFIVHVSHIIRELENFINLPNPAIRNLNRDMELAIVNGYLSMNDVLTNSKITPAQASIFKLLNNKDPYGDYIVIETKKLLTMSKTIEAFRKKLGRLRNSLPNQINIIKSKTLTRRDGYKIDIR